MKLNPINIFSNKINPRNIEQEKPIAPVGDAPAQKTELYSSDDSIAIKNMYGACIQTTKTRLQNEANQILQKSSDVIKKGDEIKQECIELTKDDDRIKKYARGMYINACNLYKEAKKYEDDTREGYFRTNGVENTTNLAYFSKGKLQSVLINVKTDSNGNLHTEHCFKYMRDNVLYQKNTVSKGNSTLSSEEEYFYIKGDFQRYDKNTVIDNGVKTTAETRLYNKGKTSYIAQNMRDEGALHSTEKIYYFDEDGFDAYVENQSEKINEHKKETTYDFTFGALTNYLENDVWEDCKNHTDLKINFRDDIPYEAFINSDMTITSYMTADKQFIFEGGKPKKAMLGYERSSIGSVTSQKEVDL